MHSHTPEAALFYHLFGSLLLKLDDESCKEQKACFISWFFL